MEQTIGYQLTAWFSDLTDTDSQVLSLGDDMRYVIEVEPGYLLRVD